MFVRGKGCKHTLFFSLKAAGSRQQAAQEDRRTGSTGGQAAPPEHFAQFVHSDMQRTASGRLVSRRVTRGQIAQIVHSDQGDRAISWP